MNLMSCNHCAVMLDADKLEFADDIYSDDGCIDTVKGRYSDKHRDYLAYVHCPVCKSPVFKEPKCAPSR